MKTQTQRGGRENWTNDTGADVAAGDVVQLGGASSDRFGIAVTDIADTEEGVVQTCGVHKLTKAAPLVVVHGEKAYWLATNELSNVSTAGKLAGRFVADGASADTEVEILLNETTDPGIR